MCEPTFASVESIIVKTDFAIAGFLERKSLPNNYEKNCNNVVQSD